MEWMGRRTFEKRHPLPIDIKDVNGRLLPVSRDVTTLPLEVKYGKDKQ